MKKTLLIIFSIIVVSFLIGAYFYPQMPDQLASHWNISGEVDGYISKFWGLFLMPIISLLMLLLFIAIPYIDPLKENIEKFRKYYDGFIVLIILFLFFIYLLTILWNLGWRFNMGVILSPALGILFFYCGILIENAKRNWFIGIRTPWTLSSDEVWDKTHKLGGKLFKISGIIAILGIFFSEYLFFFILIPVILSVIYTTIFSYFEFQKVRKNN